jgi:hypothetical protein
MAVISGYASLQTAVSDYLSRSDLTTFIPNYIQNWEERFYRNAKNWGRWMETAFSVTIASNVAAIPSAYLGTVTAYINGQGTGPLKQLSLEQLYARYPRSAVSGLPLFYARNAGNFEFGPVANDGYILNGTYYAKQTLLRSFASDAAAHWIILNAPDMALYGALLEATSFIIDDPRIPVWQSFYAEAVNDYRSQHVKERYSAPMVVAT